MRRCMCVILPLLMAAAPASNDPSAKTLIERAPIFSVPDPSARSFRFAGDVQLNLAGYTFDVAYEKPKHCALTISDAGDGTPLLAYVDRRVLIYDPFENRVFWTDRSHIEFEAAVKNDKIGINFGWNNKTAITRDAVQIDLKSFLARLHDVVVRRQTDNVLDLSGKTTSGNGTVAHIDVNKNCPFTRIDFLDAEHQNDVHFSTILKDEPIPIERWFLPSPDELKQRIPVVRIDDLSEIGMKKAIAAAGLSLTFRAAIRDPSMRPRWEKEFGQVDWQNAKRLDADASSRLRDLFQRSKTRASRGVPAETSPSSHQQ